MPATTPATTSGHLGNPGLYAEAPKDFGQPNKRHVTQIEDYVTGYIGVEMVDFTLREVLKETFD